MGTVADPRFGLLKRSRDEREPIIGNLGFDPNTVTDLRPRLTLGSPLDIRCGRIPPTHRP